MKVIENIEVNNNNKNIRNTINKSVRRGKKKVDIYTYILSFVNLFPILPIYITIIIRHT